MSRYRESSPAVAATLSVLLLAGAAAPAGAQERLAGDQLYHNYCSACHGATGEGDGPVAGVMQITVPNLRTLAMRSGGAFPADAVIAYVDGTRIPLAHGNRQMPIWGDVFASDADGVSADQAARRIEAIVEFLEELQYSQ